MMNHIAVILRGHPRTWNLIKDYTLDTYDKLAKNVDYYFVTWHVPNTGVADLLDAFNGRNLVQFVMVPIIQEYYNSYYGSSWLPYNVLPYKRLREKEVTYDAVIDSRPDIAIQLLPNKKIIPPEENSVYTTGLELHYNWQLEKKDIAVKDWFFITTSKVYDIMAQRFILQDKAGTQISYRTFAESEGINVCTINYINTMIARPNIAGIELSDKTFAEARFKSLQWAHLSKEERKEFAKAAHIREEDYNTLCLHAAI